jgi:hypothetical protein
MSNTLAIATVTAALRYLLELALRGNQPGEVGGAAVTSVRPDRIESPPGPGPARGINVYLYQLTPNHAWNLTDLPTRDSEGELARRPVAALDLHYLISCHGDENLLESQRLLGRTVLALAVTPMLQPEVIAAAVQRFADDPNWDLSFLRDADLARQTELVKFAPAVLSLEEMSRLWGILGSPYLPSVVYTATVVLLEPLLTPRPVLPVRHRVIGVAPLRWPRIERVETVPTGGPVVTGARLAVLGSGLTATGTGPGERVVRLGGTDLHPEPSGTAERIEVVIGPEVPAGVQALQVLDRGADAGGTRITGRSNAVAVVVRPSVTVLEPPGPATVKLRLQPAPRAGQDAAVILDRIDDGTATGPSTWEFPVRSGDVEIDRTGVPAGRWRVQVRVGGVDSLPELDGDVYRGPWVELP